MESLTSSAMLSEIVATLHEDMTASEVMVALISGAALSYKYDSALRPFPSMFIRGGEKDISALRMALSRIPKLSRISENTALDHQALTLLHWCLCCQPFKLRTGEKFPGADYLVEVEVSSQQRRLFEGAKLSHDSPVRSAFHGTRLESVFSILTCGLLAHMNKADLYGRGTYLTTERHVAQNFTNSASIWPNSSLGSQLRCITICEYIADHPDVRSKERQERHQTAIPEKYLLVKNNAAVRIKSLILYSTKSSRKLLSSRNIARCWSHVKTNKLLIVVLIYIVLVTFSKFSRSGPVRKLWLMLHNDHNHR
ncbi:protein mono-ADP-ribosyltransferase PARP16 [Galendromus occidentalis]|uniref:Protein mono-ADP-ribosyltransferase PARP16 n=1 Tax=Galendromus occidentalis TaxID=34638 RepID=A0AAJ7P9J8_9ACAR|nr:protein mono-ADP-ribosyltransferase PARP16 [Galendromus occidentalis]